MKKALIFKTSLLSVCILLLLNACGKTVKIQPPPQYTSWSIPQGVTMRLGKGVAYDIAYSPDGAQLAVASSIGVWLYNANTGAEVTLIPVRNDAVSSVAFSPNGRTLACGSKDGTIRLWDAVTGKRKKTSAKTFAPSGSYGRM